MISPVLSTTSRLPLSLEFSEESSSTMRSGTAPVTRITSTWRRPATWVKEPEHWGVKRQPVDKTNLRWKGCNHNPQWAAPLWQLGHLQQQEASSASPLHHLLGNHQASLGPKSASWNHLHSYPSSTGQFMNSTKPANTCYLESSISLVHIFIHILIWSNTWHRGEHQDKDTGSAVWMHTVKRGDRELKTQEQQYRLTALTEICAGCHEMNLSTWQIFTEKWLGAREGMKHCIYNSKPNSQATGLIWPLISWEQKRRTDLT